MSFQTRWIRIWSVTVLIAGLYALLEWLFFVTKPSFLSTLDWADSLRVLLVAPLPIAAWGLAGPLLLAAIGLAARSERYRRAVLRVAWMFPAGLAAGLFLVSFDVFTRTLFGFGISDSGGWGRGAYAAGFLVVLGGIHRSLAGLEQAPPARPRLQFLAGLAGCLLIAGGVPLVWGALHRIERPGGTGADAELGTPGRNGRPNILLFSGDGISAANLSVYGYERDTTPFLTEFAREALLCENAFPNAGPTGASIASMFTGKLPIQTRLIYPPEILRGKDAYQHLPAILGRLGYRRIAMSLRHYADPFDLNLRDGFDEANFRRLDQSQLHGPLSRFLDLNSVYFLEQVWDRLEGRLLHVVGIAPMVDAFAEVQQAEKHYFVDQQLIDELLRFIDASDQPFFAHIHLVGTHGPLFHPRKRVFSLGEEQTEGWMTDFYDDALLQFDQDARRVFDHLRAVGKFENSLIVVLTDHAQRYQTTERIPLILRFPGGKRQGRLQANAQLLDLSPTILDLLGVAQPTWMGGESLWRGDPNPYRPILSADRRYDAYVNRGGFMELDTAALGPPFYSLRFLRVGVCDRFFQLDLTQRSLSRMIPVGYTHPCSPEALPTAEDTLPFLLQQLEAAGYDARSLQNAVRIEPESAQP